MHQSLIVTFGSMALWACSVAVDQNDDQAPCTEQMYQRIESHIKINDPEGHGPDLGSAEWMSAVVRRLGIDGELALPEAGTRAWCAYIEAERKR